MNVILVIAVTSGAFALLGILSSKPNWIYAEPTQGR